jgi:hypothetical protein
VRVVLGDLVDGAGLLLQHQVDLSDLARDRGVDVGGALDGLDGANGVAGLDVLALLRQLDVDDIAQLLGGVLADAQDARLLVRGEVDPLVLLGVFPYRIYNEWRSRSAVLHQTLDSVFLTCCGHGEWAGTDCAGSRVSDNGRECRGPGDPQAPRN